MLSKILQILPNIKFTSKLNKYWAAPPTIHRGLEWPQCLNCLFFVCLIVCLSANWPAPPTIHRGLEWPQFLNCFFYSPHPPSKEENVGSGVEKEEDEEKPVTSSSSLLWANFLIYILLILLFFLHLSYCLLCY